jgi:hypothetical protein
MFGSCLKILDIKKDSWDLMPKPTSQEMQISGFFHWCGWGICTFGL